MKLIKNLMFIKNLKEEIYKKFSYFLPGINMKTFISITVLKV